MHNEQSSILDALVDERPFGLSSQITLQDERVICLDNGNDTAKLTLLNSVGTLVSLRIPTAYQSARTFQGGSGEVTYHMDGLPEFWIGEPAIRNDSRALPIGPTAQRLPEPRQHSFLGACMVTRGCDGGEQLLHFAPQSDRDRRAPGAHRLVQLHGSAEKDNDENLVIVDDPILARIYLKEFERVDAQVQAPARCR